jgi:hypothetical protein
MANGKARFSSLAKKGLGFASQKAKVLEERTKKELQQIAEAQRAKREESVRLHKELKEYEKVLKRKRAFAALEAKYSGKGKKMSPSLKRRLAGKVGQSLFEAAFGKKKRMNR